MSNSLEANKEHMFMWKVEDFSLCTQTKGEYIESPTFRAKSLNDTSWFMRFYPRGTADSSKGYIGCFLRRCEIDNGDFEIACEYEISITSSDGSILQANNTSYRFQKGKGWGWRDFWKKSIRSADDIDVLIVRCNLKSNARKILLRSESSGVTSFDYDQCSFTWKVKNLNSACSEVIKLPYTGTPQVEIAVENPDDDIKITIRRGDDTIKPLSVMCQITLLDVKGEKHDSRHALHLFETKESSSENDAWHFPNFLKKSKLNSEKEKYLQDDCFSLKCKIKISIGTQRDTIEDKVCDSLTVNLSPLDTGIVTVLEDMKRLFREKVHADVKLLVDSQVIQAHKSILSIRSPVFSAMFDTDMVENKTGSLNITDLEAGTVNSLLEYMYTGIVEKLDYKIATKLIVAADKYQVLPLKEKCGHFLKTVLSHANVCEVLVVADMIQHEALKCAAINYIKDHSEKIFFSAEWNRVLEENLQLAIETVNRVSKIIPSNPKTDIK